MRWSLVLCLLLVSTVIARPRFKRTLGHIKSVILTKLFGPRETTVITVHPVPAKPAANNVTYQLYKIPGFDDILIKVSKKLPNKSEVKDIDKKKEEEMDKKPLKPKDPVMVNSEVAIIGSYLGTSTEKETLMAIEVVKRLLKSGILNGGKNNQIQEIAAPMISQPPQMEYIELEQNIPKEPLHIYTQQQGYVVAPSMGGYIEQVNVINRNVMPVYPVENKPPYIAPEIEVRPVQSKYSYIQKGNDADMTYESYDNKNVIVTRTEKHPPLPQFIKLRIAEVAKIGSNPYLVRQSVPVSIPYRPGVVFVPGNNQLPQTEPHFTQRIEISSHPIKPLRSGHESEYIGLNAFGGPIAADNILLSKPLQTIKASYVPNIQQIFRCKEESVNKKCPYENIKVNNKVLPSNQDESETSKDVIVNNVVNETISDSKDYNGTVSEFLKKQSVDGLLVTQYSYKQMNHQSHANYTVVDLGVGLQTIQDSAVGSNADIPKDFVFVPPDVDVPTPISLGFQANSEAMGNADKGEISHTNIFASKVKANEWKHNSVMRRKNIDVKEDQDIKHNPIIVADTENLDTLSNARTNPVQAKTDSNVQNRGDIPGSAF